MTTRGLGLWLLVLAATTLMLAAAHAHSTRTAAQAQMEHYQRLARTHSTIGADGQRKWSCCRPCPDGTIPMLHEAFEGDKEDQPKMSGPPSEDKSENLKMNKEDAAPQKFVELAATVHSELSAEASAAATAAAAARARAGAEVALTTRMTARALAQARSQARTHVERPRKSWYSCCNMCPDLTYDPQDHWYTPSPYEYNPRELFRLTRFRQVDSEDDEEEAEGEQAEADQADAAPAASEQQQQQQQQPRTPQTILMAVDRALHRSASSSESESESNSNREDVTQGELFSAHAYSKDGAELVTMDGRKLSRSALAAALSGQAAVVIAGKVIRQSEMKGGAIAAWNPPPPPHDEKDRKLLWAPNLHDGTDLKTDSFFPPCCDFCTSTYFPHIINDEWQLPTKMPFEVKAWGAFAEVDSHTKGKGKGKGKGRHHHAAAADPAKDAEADAKAAAAKMDAEKKKKIDAAAANYKLTGNSPKCCHKCVRKNLEDRDWRVFALPEDLVRKKKKHKRKHKRKHHRK